MKPEQPSGYILLGYDSLQLSQQPPESIYQASRSESPGGGDDFFFASLPDQEAFGAQAWHEDS